MFMIMMGSIGIVGVAGNLSEETGFTDSGYVQFTTICVGGGLVFYFVSISFGSPSLGAVLASIGALIIVSTYWRK